MQLSTTQTAPQINPDTKVRLHVADHREVWDEVLPGLERLLAMYPDQDWTVDRVRELLDEDRALLLCDVEDPSGFLLVKFDRYPYVEGATELFVYLAWYHGGDYWNRINPHLELFARLGGARFMRFYSRRRAMLRAATVNGYQPRSVEYAKELDYVR